MTTTGNLERRLLKNSKDMDDELFCKHWNARHARFMKDKIPLGEGPTDTPYIINLYRQYHDTVHRQEVGEIFDHEHKP